VLQCISGTSTLVGIAAGIVALTVVGVPLWRRLQRRRHPLDPLHQLVLGVNEEHTRRALGDPLFGSLNLSGHGVLTWRLPFGYVSQCSPLTLFSRGRSH
jgi:hypothetical protein